MVAQKGTYVLKVYFSQPGEYSWPLGLTLTVLDICDTSTFPNAPTLSPTSVDFFIGQIYLSVAVQWDKDTVSVQTGVDCGGYSIRRTLITASSTLTASIDTSLTKTEEIDLKNFKFFTSQTNLAGSILVYEIKIVSTEIDIDSPSTLLTVKVLACTMQLNDWITTKSPVT